MDPTLTAEDLWPLVRKLTPDEQMKLVRLALRAGTVEDAGAYRAAPVRAGEFESEEDGLDWEPEGWEEFDAPR